MANAGRLAAGRADKHDVGNVDLCLAGHEAAVLALSVRTLSLLDESDALDDDLAVRGERAQDFALRHSPPIIPNRYTFLKKR